MVLNNFQSWIEKQARLSLSQFDRNMRAAYPSSRAGLENAHSYLDVVGKTCNYIEACTRIDFSSFLSPGAKVLDLGCGGGWLGALISKIEAVETIYALDSSTYFLRVIAPDVLALMNACSEKFMLIEGLFSPLLFEDSTLDLVVCSSALHHADALQPILEEIHRTLKSGGYLIILNETPRPGGRYLLSAFVASLRILKDLMLQTYHALSPSISSSSYLYDPVLGDRDYPRWYWEKSLNMSGFNLESIIDTGLTTLKGGHGRSLIHFICRAN